MKTRNFVLGALALSSVAGGISLVGAQSQANSAPSFTIGNYQFRAQQQNNGLMRGVTIYKVSDYGSSEATIIIYAKFARQDQKNPKRWILGDMVIHLIGGKNSNQSTMKAKQFTFFAE